MCMRCEGFSHDDVMAFDAATIAEYGYMVTGVGGENDPPILVWAYTVGLIDLTGHPELIIAGPEFDHGGALLNEVGRAIRDGASFAPGDTFNVWHSLRHHGVLVASELEAVQVFRAVRVVLQRTSECPAEPVRPRGTSR